MSIPKAAGIETEYGIVIRGAPRPDPFLASRLLLSGYRQGGHPFVSCHYPYYPPQNTTEYPGPSAVQGAEEVAGEYGIASLRRKIRRPGRVSPAPETGQAPAKEPQTPYTPDDYGMYDLMLANGARFYIDHAHPEYSTPECLSPRMLVAADKAGEIILDRCRQWVSASRALPSGQEILIYKNNSDHKGNSYGCHENYLLDAAFFENLLYRKVHWVFRYLLPFLITRIILCGAGKVGAENGTPAVGFQISQRADFFGELIGPQTSYQRPLFNTRDEPHADPARFRRLHVILGDANMAEFSTYLKVGTTQLVLRMLEDQFIRADFTLADPLAALQIVARDLSFRQPLRLESGQKMTAVEIQEMYLALARQYLEQAGGSDEERDVLEKWADALDALQTDWRRLATRLDWAIKKNLLDHYLAAQQATWEEVTVWQPVIEMTLDLDIEAGRMQTALAASLDDLRTRDPERAAMVERHVKEHGLSWEHYSKQRELYFGLRRLDLEYHDIRRGPGEENMGLFYRLQNRGVIERLLTDDEIAPLVTEPPPDTRAWLRGHCVARFAPHIVLSDWSQVRFRSPGSGYQPDYLLTLMDPLSGTERDIGEAWEAINSVEQIFTHFGPPVETFRERER